MSRRRYISTDVSLDKRLNRLAEQQGDFAALLYTWMVPHAADDATMNGDLDEFMAAVLPMRRDKTEADVRRALSAMDEVGLIEWYEDLITFPLEAFYRYQSYIKVENRRTAEITGKRRSTPTNADEQRKTPITTDELSPPDSTPENADERRKTPENAASSSPSFPLSLPPSPSPRGDAHGDGGDPGLKRAIAALERCGVKVSFYVQDGVVGFLDEGTKPEWFDVACSIAAGNGKTTWNYIKAILAGWGTDGPPLSKAASVPAAGMGEPEESAFDRYQREQEESERKWAERTAKGIIPAAPTKAEVEAAAIGVVNREKQASRYAPEPVAEP